MNTEEKLVVMALIVGGAYAITYMLPSKNRNIVKRHKKYDHSKTHTLDLVYNNKEEGFSLELILHGLAAAFIGFFVGGAFFVLSIEKLSKIYSALAQPKNSLIFGGIVALIVTLLIIKRSSKWFIRLQKAKKKFQYDDIVFEPKKLKLSPFLFTSGKYNPEIASSLLKDDRSAKKLDYISISWNDIETIRIFDKKRDDDLYYFIEIKTNKRKYLLDRRKFAYQEKEFFNLVLSFCEIKIINQSRFKRLNRGLISFF